MRQGSVAPDFELPDQNGVPVRLSTLLASGPVVLFFYPGAMTPVCTLEACHFRDTATDFAEVGASVIGISGDGVGKQKAWDDEYDLGYPLLSDRSGDVADAYGVKRAIGILPAKRKTFVIGADGLVLDVIASEINADKHADDALKLLRAL